jgi:hypothetical protein
MIDADGALLVAALGQFGSRLGWFAASTASSAAARRLYVQLLRDRE